MPRPRANRNISTQNWQSKKACRLPWAFWLNKCGPQFLQRLRERWSVRIGAGYTDSAGRGGTRQSVTRTADAAWRSLCPLKTDAE